MINANGVCSPTGSPVLSERVFTRFSTYIERELGIKMPISKRIMLQSRLQKRLRILGIAGFEEYYDHVFGRPNQELVHFIDAVTTNKTGFFREPRHFDYLRESALPILLSETGEQGQTIRAWSAGCSTGEEPYSLAMILSEYMLTHPGFQYSIVATDISSRALEAAAEGVYSETHVEPVPTALRHKYLLRSKDARTKLVRIVPALRARICFSRLNLMSQFPFKNDMGIIFCRNVLIYFSHQDQERLILRFWRQLKPGGYLFIGHSETLAGFPVPLTQVAPTVYRKPST